MHEHEVAWAAGFLDGEGYFGIRTKGRYHTPVIEASQVASREPLDNWNPKAGSHGAWRWTIAGSKRVLPALIWITPYLTVKFEQARLLIVMCQITAPRGTPFSEIEVLMRESVVAQLAETRRSSWL
jgi:hypothetical protein